jgi:predicted RNase H-like nuclease (RuvC/YqgF family)
MSDIVERLRSSAIRGYDHRTVDLVTKAADEIERLRAQGDNAHDSIAKENEELERENGQLQAEIERLRNLQKITADEADTLRAAFEQARKMLHIATKHINQEGKAK